MAEIYYFLGHEQYQPEVLVKQAKIAEDSGFDGVFVSEHFHPWVEDKGAAGYAFSTLGAIAVSTSKIKMMTGVVAPLFRYHPAVVAQAAATVDRLSNGRFLLGLGAGESINESPLGYSFPKYAERSERLTEALTIIRKLLQGEKVSYKGTYYTVENAKLYSPPVSKVSLYLAAGGPKSAELAATIADGLIVSVKDVADANERVIGPYRSNLQTSGHVAASRWTIYAKNPKESWDALGAWRGLRAPSRDSATDPMQLQKEADSMDQKEILSRYTIINELDEYITAYEPLITQVKADIVIIQTTTATDQDNLIRMLGKTILPQLKKASSGTKE